MNRAIAPCSGVSWSAPAPVWRTAASSGLVGPIVTTVDSGLSAAAAMVVACCSSPSRAKGQATAVTVTAPARARTVRVNLNSPTKQVIACISVPQYLAGNAPVPAVTKAGIFSRYCVAAYLKFCIFVHQYQYITKVMAELFRRRTINPADL